MLLKKLIEELTQRGRAPELAGRPLSQSDALRRVAEETVLETEAATRDVLGMGLSDSEVDRGCYCAFFGRRGARRPRRATFLAGGRGGRSILAGALDVWSRLDVIVNAYDDGLSTGRLRECFGILGPSDIRKNHATLLRAERSQELSLASLLDWRMQSRNEFDRILSQLRDPGGPPQEESELDKEIRDLTPTARHWLNTYLGRFKASCESEGLRALDFRDMSLGNCVYVGAYLLLSRDFTFAVRAVERLLLELRSSVHLCSEEVLWLCAVDGSGRLIPSEADLVETKHRHGVSSIFLLPQPPDRMLPRAVRSWDSVHPGLSRCLEEWALRPAIAPDALSAVMEADQLVYCPGTFHSSLAPTLLTEGLGAAIDASRASRVYVVNLDNDNESVGFEPADYVRRAHDLLRRDVCRPDAHFFDYVLCDAGSPAGDLHALARELEFEVIRRPLRASDGRSHDGEVTRRFLRQIDELRHAHLVLRDGVLRRTEEGFRLTGPSGAESSTVDLP